MKKKFEDKFHNSYLIISWRQNIAEICKIIVSQFLLQNLQMNVNQTLKKINEIWTEEKSSA
jgi:hypothetical protein